MNKPDIATIIDLHFEELTELEQEIARYFLQAETIQDDLSSQQVTQKLHISQAALTRFAKKCGFTGYREFVFQYQHQASKPDTHSHKHSPLTKRVLRSYSIMREQTQDLIDEEQLERVAQLIDDAERVYFFGTGSSGLIAREMKLRFMRLGVVCEALTDREMGAKTILFTSAPNKNSQAYTETVLVASHSQSSYIQRISAQLPMLILIDLIYAYFLEINRDSKEKIFNSYWENKKLNGYRRQKRVRKS